MIGVFGQWWLTSGYHWRGREGGEGERHYLKYKAKLVKMSYSLDVCITGGKSVRDILHVYECLTLALTFSNDAGLTREKHIKNTSWR